MELKRAEEDEADAGDSFDQKSSVVKSENLRGSIESNSN